MSFAFSVFNTNTRVLPISCMKYYLTSMHITILIKIKIKRTAWTDQTRSLYLVFKHPQYNKLF